MTLSLDIREERPDDIPAIREVNNRAFGQTQEANIVDAPRSNAAMLLSLVATINGQVVGHILYSPATIGDMTGAALAPMAVLPEHQRYAPGTMHRLRRLLFVNRSVLVLLWATMCLRALSAQEIANEPRRETWQRVPDLFRAMAVREGAIVADVGAGEGFLTVRLSPLVGNSGKVYAVDSDKSVADGLRQRVRDAQMTNVEIITGADDDPHLPRGLDAVIILNSYHEIKQGVTMLRHIHDSLKPGAALVLCEPVPATVGQTRAAQMEDHVLYPEIIVDDLQQAGFQIVDREDTFATNLGGTHFGLVVARRP